MKERLTSRKFAHLLIVLTILLGLMAYRTWFDGVDGVGADAKNDRICDLSHTPCQILIGGAPLTVALSDPPLRAEQAFQIRLDGVAQGQVPSKSWLEGQEMFMGRIPVFFERQGEEQWLASTQVGACTSHRMVWLLVIEWDNGERQQVALSVTR